VKGKVSDKVPSKLDWFTIKKKLAELKLKQGRSVQPSPKPKKHRV
jgi:hypothetical protein